jgi:hypothetical protein
VFSPLSKSSTTSLPQRVRRFPPEHELPSPLDEQEEHLHRDAFEMERLFAPSEPEVGGIELKSAKAQVTRVHLVSPYT